MRDQFYTQAEVDFAASGEIADHKRQERDEILPRLKAGDFDGLTDQAIYDALRGTPYQCVLNGEGERKIVRRRPR